MSTILYRSAELTPGTGRTVYGLAVPYGQVAEVSDGGGRLYREMFAPGSFARSITERGSKVRLFTGHDRVKLPIGRAVELSESHQGLHASFEVAQTRDGDDALELVRSGTVDSFSIGFRGVRDHMDRGVLVRDECALFEVSLVGIPSYEGAAVGGIRTQPLPCIPRAIAMRRLSILDW